MLQNQVWPNLCMVQQHMLQLFSDEQSVLRLVFSDAPLCQQTCYKQYEQKRKNICASVSLIRSLPVNLPFTSRASSTVTLLGRTYVYIYYKRRTIA